MTDGNTKCNNCNAVINITNNLGSWCSLVNREGVTIYFCNETCRNDYINKENLSWLK